ncbi:MAG: bifunctional nuclease family protein [Proteobacteria bacterium]|nr:bifunctional nuclease family protein [Pseudomonadota bacterium]
MAVQMKVMFVAFDPKSDRFTVLLKDLENRYVLPIWIGPFEANAIALRLRKIDSHRPMTHDLLCNILTVFNSEIVKVEVVELRDKTFYAVIHIRSDGKEIALDSRPSDAIAIALRAGAPIYANESVLTTAETFRLDQLQEWLKSLKPGDIKYRA